jgi:hypothetical protein
MKSVGSPALVRFEELTNSTISCNMTISQLVLEECTVAVSNQAGSSVGGLNEPAGIRKSENKSSLCLKKHGKGTTSGQWEV